MHSIVVKPQTACAKVTSGSDLGVGCSGGVAAAVWGRTTVAASGGAVPAATTVLPISSCADNKDSCIASPSVLAVCKSDGLGLAQDSTHLQPSSEHTYS